MLGARAEQLLHVRIAPEDGRMYYQIINPDASRLQGGTDAAQEFHGKLRQTGDHIVEVVNQTDAPVAFDLIVDIE